MTKTHNGLPFAPIGVPFTSGQPAKLTIAYVHPGIWALALKEAKKHGIRLGGKNVISKTKVEFICAH
jgi:hypothetical protein